MRTAVIENNQHPNKQNEAKLDDVAFQVSGDAQNNNFQFLSSFFFF